MQKEAAIKYILGRLAVARQLIADHGVAFVRGEVDIERLREDERTLEWILDLIRRDR